MLAEGPAQQSAQPPESPQPATNTPKGSSFPESLSRLFHQLGDPFQFLVRNLSALGTEQRRNDLLCRAFEKRIHEMFQRRLPHFMPRYRRRVNISKPYLFVADVLLVFQHSQLCSYCGIARIAGEVGHHLAGSRATSPIQDVHDLSFAARQIQMRRLTHMRSL